MRAPFTFILALSLFTSQLQAQWALDFNGGEDHVVLNGSDFPPPWTMEVKISKNETDNYQHLLTSTDGNSGIRNEQWWGTQVGFTRSGVADYYFNYSLPIGQWVHLAMVNHGTTTQLFVNGNSVGTVSASIDFPMKWISKPNTEASLKARIDELRIWNTNLSQPVIQQYMDQEVDPSHPDYTNLQHYYQFEEGSGNICHDSKGSLHGTIYGATWYTETDYDIGIIKLAAPERNPDNYSSSEALTLQLKNYGLMPVGEDFTVSYTLNGAAPVSLAVNASQDPIPSNETFEVNFPPVNMNTSGTYSFIFFVDYAQDENPGNDTLAEDLVSNSHLLGEVTDFTVIDGNHFEFTCSNDKVKVIFYKEGMFRLWLGVNGVFTNPAGNLIVESYEFPQISVDWADEGERYRLETEEVILLAYKSPLRFELWEKGYEKLIWGEVTPLDHGTRTFQYLERGGDEYFYGGGMQNGYFSHRDKKIKISKEISHWDDGAVPNPVPFYMSTAGYGAFRNTFSKGEYDFTEPVGVSHDEQRFDCFYFHGDLKRVLDLYTELTGRPILPPRWGLELGDADCYNDEGQTTPDVIETIADRYRDEDLPGGWILPNDGYGCGYVKLDSVVEELSYRGFHTGLWTESGLSQLPWEVGTAGVRAYKLDVAWVGSGYQYALNACKQAYQGIENNCDERGFVWSVCGWAGTQRYSVVWSGDQSGNWEFIRFHIPTLIGAGLSGYHLASSDLDGIFGGSQQTYIRDLQWKTFIPVFYAMSGWASRNRQPWVYNTATTNINRKFLKLKMRLTPYMYTYCHQAYETGVPAVRAMVLEYPEDSITRDATTRYQFMSGKWFLVAPVYTASTTRDSIYLPFGPWFDYWDGTLYQGPAFLDGYNAPIDKLPVFVKGGAIIPMYPEMLYDGQKPLDTLTLDVYPFGWSEFDLYEDDGLTRQHREGAYAITHFECYAPPYDEPGVTQIIIGPSEGDFEGKLAERAYWCEVHIQWYPHHGVNLNDEPLTEYTSLEELYNAAEGFFHDHQSEGGLVYIKTPSLPTAEQHVIVIDYEMGNIENEIGEGIRIYPNPTKGIVFIDASPGQGMEVTVSDTNGRVLLMDSFSGHANRTVKLDLGLYPEGNYLLTVVTGEKKMVKKVVIAR